jgi:hypothetical protein
MKVDLRSIAFFGFVILITLFCGVYALILRKKGVIDMKRNILLLSLALALLALPVAANEDINATEIDDPDTSCGQRCPNPPTNACVYDSLTLPEHWCGLTKGGGDCVGGYDPDLCGAESAF